MRTLTARNLSYICRKHGIALMYLFGSQARAGAKMLAGENVEVNDPLTDLDVGVITEKPLPGPNRRGKFYAALYNELEDLFKPLRLDLVLLEENHSVFQLEAIKGICIYQSSQERRDDYEMMILRRAADFRPTAYPTDDALRKIIYLATVEVAKKWTMPIRRLERMHFTDWDLLCR